MSWLVHLLQTLRQLRDLTLIDFDWTGEGGPSQISIDEPNLVASYATIPVLYTLIHLLRDGTKILRICVCRSMGSGVRWHRSTRTEEFQADRYVVKR
jgi:hypothetical protein